MKTMTVFLCACVFACTLSLSFGQSLLFWSAGGAGYPVGEIHRAELDGSNDTIIADTETILGDANNAFPYSIAVDEVNETVYWNEVNHGHIMQVGFDGSDPGILFNFREDPTVLDTYGLGSVKFIAVDPEEGKVFFSFTDVFQSLIGSIDFDGTNIQVLRRVNGSSSSGILIAVEREDKEIYMYRNFVLEKMNYDGSGLSTVSSNLITSSMSFDPYNRKIYFTDYENDLLLRSNYDGSEMETVLDVKTVNTPDATHNNLSPNGISVDPFNEKIYWCERSRLRIVQRANFDGSNVETLAQSSYYTRPLFASVSFPWPGANQTPFALNDSATTFQSESVEINVLANDIDPDIGDVLVVNSIPGVPGNGSAVNGVSSVSYIPNPGFVGDDSFVYEVSDGRRGFATASVSVTVISRVQIISDTLKDLLALKKSGAIPQKNANALARMLRNSRSAFQNGDLAGGCQATRAFIKEVKKLIRLKTIKPKVGNPLVRDIKAARALNGC